ncbi:hypothetical protein JZ751_014546, partial [Albula glossodonta]
MSLTASGANFSSPTPTATLYDMKGHVNSTATTTTMPMSVTMLTNDTTFNTTKLPEVEPGGSGMGMVLVPFGIITVIGLAVVMMLYIRKRKRLEKLRHQLMPMYNFDPAEEQDELEQELLDHGREGAGTGANAKVCHADSDSNTLEHFL